MHLCPIAHIVAGKKRTAASVFLPIVSAKNLSQTCSSGNTLPTTRCLRKKSDWIERFGYQETCLQAFGSTDISQRGVEFVGISRNWLFASVFHRIVCDGGHVQKAGALR
ncbi:MAG TPA: hypothetical protein VIM62_02030 [Acidobacteriaceae bacterium]